MKKSVVIALIYFLVFYEIYCNGFSIKLAKISQEVDFTIWLMSSATCEGHMRSTLLEVEESVYLTSNS